MKIKKLTIIISLLLGLIPIALYLYFYKQLPDQIATSFGFDGTINDYSSKNSTLFLMFLPIILVAVLAITPRIDPKGKNYDKFGKYYGYFIIVLTLIMSISMSMLVLHNIVTISLPIHIIIPITVGIFFILIGNYMPKMKQTYTMGIKTPWTLDNEIVWNKTHRLGGKCFMIMGVLMIVISFIPRYDYLLLVLVLVIATIPTVMSYVYYKQELKKDNPSI